MGKVHTSQLTSSPFEKQAPVRRVRVGLNDLACKASEREEEIRLHQWNIPFYISHRQSRSRAPLLLFLLFLLPLLLLLCPAQLPRSFLPQNTWSAWFVAAVYKRSPRRAVGGKLLTVFREMEVAGRCSTGDDGRVSTSSLHHLVYKLQSIISAPSRLCPYAAPHHSSALVHLIKRMKA
jgi:hypothetical protein